MSGSRQTPKSVGSGLVKWQLDLALRHLSSDLSADFTVARLAALCGLSRSYFARAFKVSMGLPPHHWLMHHRIACAQNMLETTNDSISAVALACGFADQSHLTRVFHAIVGTSPAAWRRRRKAGVA